MCVFYNQWNNNNILIKITQWKVETNLIQIISEVK